MLFLQRNQYVFGSGVLACFGFFGLGVELEFVEEQFAHLSGAVDIKRFARECVDTLLKRIEFFRQSRFRLFEFGHINPHSGSLHFPEDGHQGQFDLVVEIPEVGIGFESLPVGFFIRIECHFGVEKVLTKAVLDGVEYPHPFPSLRGGRLFIFGSSKEIELIRVGGRIRLPRRPRWTRWTRYTRDTRRTRCTRWTRRARYRREFAEQGVELEVLIEFCEGIEVGFFFFQERLVQSNGYIRADGSQEFGELDLFNLRLHFGTQGTFDLVRMGKHVFDRAELPEQRHRRLLADAFAAGYIIAGIAHKA